MPVGVAAAMGEDLPAVALARRPTPSWRRSRRRCTGRRTSPPPRARSPGWSTAAVLIDTLSAPASSSSRMSSTVRTPPPTVSGMKQASAVRRTTSSRMPRSSWLAVMSRKQSSSAPGRVIGLRRLDRVAGVAQVDELHALDDAPVLHVEAGDEADLEHVASDRRRRESRAPRMSVASVKGHASGKVANRGARSPRQPEVWRDRR